LGRPHPRHDPAAGIQKYLRGAAWLVLPLADTGVALTLRDLATCHPIGFAIGAAAVLVVLEFGFFLVSSRRQGGGTVSRNQRVTRSPS
jgi:hypothetical protein